ncbi:hypothetical protein SAY87_021374 [Trapa incisa]|uniref:Ribosomal protein L34Ae n=1 Tax=Trapa incisa TaxID=236973 RepID=A0AAN7JS00_9MYRT|nr:hypothetical protein SAY87_021374 [Trapa incisa]
MPCSSEEEALSRLFYNVSSSFLLLLLLLHLALAIFSGILDIIGDISIFRSICRNQEEEEEEEEGGGGGGGGGGGEEGEEGEEGEGEEGEEEEEVLQHGHSFFRVGSIEEADLLDGVIRGGEALSFMHVAESSYKNIDQVTPGELRNCRDAPLKETTEESLISSDDQFSASDSISRELPAKDSEPVRNSVSSTGDEPLSPAISYEFQDDPANGIPVHDDEIRQVEDMNELPGDGRRLISTAMQEVEAKNFQGRSDVDKDAFVEIFGESCTAGSTSKSSSEWRTSTINCRDSGTEDPFSSSSRRSCHKWESYTLFQKYDEEMMFLDRISAQKLHETEALRSVKVKRKSIPEGVVHKVIAKKRRPPGLRHNPYYELEAAYVAEICLTWEALSWNYKNFHSKHASKDRDDPDPGCSGRVAQQFQQFQVLLQRYVENEPFERGRRPEVYARKRQLSTKLLQVPEYRDSEDHAEHVRSRIASTEFLDIMEDGIRTFMDFLRADKMKPGQVIASFFRRNKRGSVNPALMKKVNKKKTRKLKDMGRAGACIIGRRKLSREMEMEILMALIDLNVVSRVLRISDLSEEQLHWCEEKMSKVRIWQGRLQRDSSPLFFPAH